MNAPRIIVMMTALLALAACATPETRVRNGLISAGLSAPISACMADRMVDRLSLGQLSKLNGLGKLRKHKAGDVTINEFVKQTRALQDPEIVGVVTSSGVVCAVK
ncbi:hypothetical protein [Sphingorhabdus sp. M41]|uniref:hypothetical protein n=1 Tax=Sphingorhabdus sp. M41 TaxID=1806885 RepID=UPI00078C7869|nr:hypothetical protein [Sphingorhabdus sp. M41]AMO73011.1 hypothetical protein AZE99_15160 [Sphingorhabdus sp. M41]